MRLTIRGLQEAQDANLHNIAMMRPTGALGRMVQYATVAAHRYAVLLTHVDTGALRASHRMRLSGSRGEIYIDAARNPKSGALTSRYGPTEHRRGGSHAFYERTDREYGLHIAEMAARGFIGELR